jgi:hypothetical protein
MQKNKLLILLDIDGTLISGGLMWDGRTDAGEYVSSGIYIVLFLVISQELRKWF